MEKRDKRDEKDRMKMGKTREIEIEKEWKEMKMKMKTAFNHKKYEMLSSVHASS